MSINNSRNAGRKKALNDDQVKEILLRRENGETVSSLANEYNISRQTLSQYLNAYEFEPKSESGKRIFANYKLWARINRFFRDTSLSDYTLRIDYMHKDILCSAILVDFSNERIKVYNNTDDVLLRAFGIKAAPTWNDFNVFLNERCIPETRFQIKGILKDLGLEQYDTLRILEKTGGRTGEDNQWMKFTYLKAE